MPINYLYSIFKNITMYTTPKTGRATSRVGLRKAELTGGVGLLSERWLPAM